MDILDELKRKLRVSWNDDDSYLAEIIKRAQDYMNIKCGCEFDFAETGQHKTLMLERCFYDFNNALQDFEKNYQGELLALIVASAHKKKPGRKRSV